MEKRTELRDVLHFYLGCELMHSFDNELLSVGRMIGITESEVNPGETVVITSENFSEWFIVDIKPILRRLSSMTEEEAEKLVLILFDDVDDKIDPEELQLILAPDDHGLMVDADMGMVIEVSCRCFEGQIALRKCGSILMYDDGGELCRVHNLPHAFKYLLSIGMDLFQLLDSGQAIEQTPEKS